MTLLKKKKRKIFRQCLGNYFMLMASLEGQKVHEIHQTIGCLLVFRWILKQAVHHPTSFPPQEVINNSELESPEHMWKHSINRAAIIGSEGSRSIISAQCLLFQSQRSLLSAGKSCLHVDSPSVQYSAQKHSGIIPTMNSTFSRLSSFTESVIFLLLSTQMTMKFVNTAKPAWSLQGLSFVCLFAVLGSHPVPHTC